jgi:succinoglycan biosynthesis transport protein ExoP
LIARPPLDRPLLGPQSLHFEMEAWQLEELTKLVRAIFLSSGTESSRSGPDRTLCNRTVIFASSESGNGASWICARAAELLASQVTGRVCLVDANLEGPTLHELFGVPNHHGLAEALCTEDSIGGYVSQLSRWNLALVSAGLEASAGSPDTKNRNLAGSNLDGDLSGQHMRRRLQELRAEFDYVLVDAASLDAGDSAIALAGLADGIVLVLKTHSTRRERVRRRLQDLKSAGVRVLGAVLNQPAC